MTFLKVPKCPTLIGAVFQMLLKELKARSVIFNDLAPSLDANIDVAVFVDKSAIAIRATLNHSPGVVRHIIRDRPKVPPNPRNRVESLVRGDGEGVLDRLRHLFVTDRDRGGF